MILARERELVAGVARRLRSEGLVVGTAGNLSVRAGEFIAITPSAVDYDDLTKDDVAVVDFEGEHAYGDAEPSTELQLHLALYHAGAGAVVHTHSAYATAVGLVLDELPAIHYLVADLGGPVRVAPYAPPATHELADLTAKTIEGRSAVLLRNHGAVTIGRTLAEAHGRAQLLEWLARVYITARLLGEPAVLQDAEVDAMLAHMERYRR